MTHWWWWGHFGGRQHGKWICNYDLSSAQKSVETINFFLLSSFQNRIRHRPVTLHKILTKFRIHLISPHLNIAAQVHLCFQPVVDSMKDLNLTQLLSNSRKREVFPVLQFSRSARCWIAEWITSVNKLKSIFPNSGRKVRELKFDDLLFITMNFNVKTNIFRSHQCVLSATHRPKSTTSNKIQIYPIQAELHGFHHTRQIAVWTLCMHDYGIELDSNDKWHLNPIKRMRAYKF